MLTSSWLPRGSSAALLCWPFHVASLYVCLCVCLCVSVSVCQPSAGHALKSLLIACVTWSAAGLPASSALLGSTKMFIFQKSCSINICNVSGASAVRVPRLLWVLSVCVRVCVCWGPRRLCASNIRIKNVLAKDICQRFQHRRKKPIEVQIRKEETSRARRGKQAEGGKGRQRGTDERQGNRRATEEPTCWRNVRRLSRRPSTIVVERNECMPLNSVCVWVVCVCWSLYVCVSCVCVCVSECACECRPIHL